MLAGILFLTLIVVVGVLITADVVRSPSPTDASIGLPDRHGHEAERSVTPARSGAGAHAFAREPVVREKPVPAAALGTRADADPFEVASFERPDQPARGFDQLNRDVPPSAGSDAQRGKFNATFVNLSRRSQALVERQLRLIESLEHGEQDQHRLASLSRLNRVAMRIHRNSQNLLVLAGQEPSTSWNQPVTLAHLVEAAVSEVEEYQRVSFEVQPDIAVRGPAVHDAVHLLVELIDNATSFSAADMQVYIKGQVLTSGGALIDITDRGIGMAAKEMAFANQQLDNPPPPDMDIPKWMGLLVVARLAARHGIRVRLNQAEYGGLTALVWLPDEILTHYGAGAGADPGYAAAEQRAAVTSSPGFAPTRTSPDVPAARPDPAWSARGSQTMVYAEPTAAVRVPAGPPDAPSGDVGVVVPQAEGQTRGRRLPIFDEVESRWSRHGRDASGPQASRPQASGPQASGTVGLTTASGLATASGPVSTPGPATTSGPSATAPTTGGPATGGLPRRASAAPQAQHTVPGMPPVVPGRPGATGGGWSGFQRGAAQDWAPPAEEANPDEA
jgi:histidine kinase/DNA gyrase B/HSP90-like ATPase